MDHGVQVRAPSPLNSRSQLFFFSSHSLSSDSFTILIAGHIYSIPYAPYSKSDKITRIADWHDPALEPTGPSTRPGQRQNFSVTQNRRPGREAYGASEINAFGYVHDEDEKSFSLVDSGARPTNKARLPARGRGRGGFAPGGLGRGGARGRGGAFQSRGGFGGRGRGGGRGGYSDWNRVS